MSFKYYKPARSRLQRSELAVPGSSPEMFEKALNSKADYIFLDLEDAVSPMDKVSARQNVIKALKEINWNEKGKTISKSIYPNVYDGLNGIKFIEKTVESSTSNSLWVKF